MNNQDNKTASMTYEEAVKYRKEHRILTKKDRLKLESQCDEDKPFPNLDRKYVEAQAIVNEHNIENYLNCELP